MNLAIMTNQEHLALLNAFDLTFNLVQFLDIREGRDVLELILLDHLGGSSG